MEWKHNKIELFLYRRMAHFSTSLVQDGRLFAMSAGRIIAKLLSATVLPLILLATLIESAAEPFPSSIIRIVVPAGPGTPPDILSRIVADELAMSEGWRFVVENRPGGLQTIAMTDVAKQPADGSSVLVMSLPMMVTPSLLPSSGLRPEVDFAPVAKIATSYTVLVVHPSVPADSISELTNVLKGNPGKLNFSSAGFGTPSHLIGEMFLLQTGTHATHVPYQQFPQAIADLVGGTNQYMFVTTFPVIDLIATGKLRALAVTAPTRIGALKQVPSVKEEGYSGLVTEDWVGFAVRRGTSVEITTRLNQAINRVIAKPKVREAFAKIGADPAGGTSAEFGDLIKAQVARWAIVIKDADIKLPQ